jgi:excisionase family DNA binding protein
MPRLLDVQAAARYLGVSPWTVRELEWKGVLRRVRVPLPGGGELRKLLFDKADLDRLIEGWKEAA